MSHCWRFRILSDSVVSEVRTASVSMSRLWKNDGDVISYLVQVNLGGYEIFAVLTWPILYYGPSTI
jgi:hypothetical protein